MYYFLTALAWFLSKLSDNALDLTARGLAFFTYSIVGLRRRVIDKNLAIAYGELSAQERQRLATASLRNFALTVLEFFRSAHRDPVQRITFSGAEIMRAALDQEKGVYILCCHIGNWEAMGAAMTRAFVPSHVIIKKVGSPSVHRFVSEIRAKNGFLGITRQKKGDGTRSVTEALDRGEIVAFAHDQVKHGSPRMPFFGQPASTNTGLAFLWQRRPAPIVPSFIERTAVGTHVVHFLPAIDFPPSTGDAEADTLARTALFNQTIEAIIRRFPEQYFWLHNRWK